MPKIQTLFLKIYLKRKLRLDIYIYIYQISLRFDQLNYGEIRRLRKMFIVNAYYIHSFFEFCLQYIQIFSSLCPRLCEINIGRSVSSISFDTLLKAIENLQSSLSAEIKRTVTTFDLQEILLLKS